MKFNVFFDGTRYECENRISPTWLDVMTRILAILRSTLVPSDYEIRQENGTVMDAAASTAGDWPVSFFMRKKGTNI